MAGESALEGIRVLELGGRWATPHCSALLGEMGADVIKVEEPGGDSSRGAGRPSRWEAPFLAAAIKNLPPYNRAGSFLMINRNKLSTGIDFRKPEGRELFLRLVKVSDVVVENMRPGRLDKMGLDYETLKATNPKLIMCSMGGYGKTGPDRFRRAVGITIEPYSFASVTGYPGEGPMRSGVDHVDPLSGVYAAGAILSALIFRHRTGESVYIDLSFAECAICTVGQYVVDYTLNQRLPARSGNKSPLTAPHGCYRCKGDDSWLAIAVRNDREWQQLCQVIGDETLAKDEKFCDAASRWQNREELDRRIEEWSQKMDGYDAMKLLQEVGVPAGAVLSIDKLVGNPHLKAREFFTEIPYPTLPTTYHRTFGPRFKLSETPLKLYRPAPCYGEHNKEVWVDRVGLGEAELERFIQNKVIFNDPFVERKDLF